MDFQKARTCDRPKVPHLSRGCHTVACHSIWLSDCLQLPPKHCRPSKKTVTIEAKQSPTILALVRRCNNPQLQQRSTRFPLCSLDMHTLALSVSIQSESDRHVALCLNVQVAIVMFRDLTDPDISGWRSEVEADPLISTCAANIVFDYTIATTFMAELIRLGTLTLRYEVAQGARSSSSGAIWTALDRTSLEQTAWDEESRSAVELLQQLLKDSHLGMACEQRTENQGVCLRISVLANDDGLWSVTNSYRAKRLRILFSLLDRSWDGGGEKLLQPSVSLKSNLADFRPRTCRLASKGSTH